MTAYTYERSLRSPVVSETRKIVWPYKDAIRAITTMAVLFTLAIGAVALKAAIWLPAFTSLH